MKGKQLNATNVEILGFTIGLLKDMRLAQSTENFISIERTLGEKGARVTKKKSKKMGFSKERMNAVINGLASELKRRYKSSESITIDVKTGYNQVTSEGMIKSVPNHCDTIEIKFNGGFFVGGYSVETDPT